MQLIINMQELGEFSLPHIQNIFIITMVLFSLYTKYIFIN